MSPNEKSVRSSVNTEEPGRKIFTLSAQYDALRAEYLDVNRAAESSTNHKHVFVNKDRRDQISC